MNPGEQKNSAYFSGFKSAWTIGLVAFLIVVLAIPTAFLLVKHQFSHAQNTASVSSHTYYVSKNGNDADGLSWATAWNELNQINWNLIQPGDSILLDGGTSQMVYTTTLTVGKSGVSGSPITIRRATDPGRNGTVAIFGGRSTLLPYCGQTNYTYQTRGVNIHGIVINSQSWIIVDGGGWHGIKVYGNNDSGAITQNTNNDIIRNLELFDNGSASQRSDGTWHPFQPNIGLSSATNMTFEYLDIHDAGEDSFQPNNINNITIRLSWLHDTRSDPNYPGLAFNQCNHNDGMQIWNSNPVSGVTFDQDILGPGHENDLILGNGVVEVDNVAIKNTLFIDAGANAIWGEPEKNWTVDHVTSFTQGGNNVDLKGTGNNITNSIFYGSNINVNATSSNNCMWKTGGLNGQTADPMFVTDLTSYPNSGSRTTNYPALSTAANFDFSLKPGSPCAGLGSSITSVAQLVNLANHQTQPAQTQPAQAQPAQAQPTQTQPTGTVGGGVSPLIFGTNLYLTDSSDQFITSQVSRNALKNAGIQIIRMPIRVEGAANADELLAMQDIKAMGAIPYIVLKFSQPDPLGAAKLVIQQANSIFGNSVVYYEFGNERDINGVDQVTYTNAWNQVFPQVKSLALNGKFGGPAASWWNSSYIAYFVEHANPQPDFISWHEYFCSSADTTGVCIGKIASLKDHINSVKSAIQANPTHKTVPPIILSEWNYSGSSDPNATPQFLQQWTQTFLQELANDGVFASMQYAVNGWGSLDLLNPDGTLTPEGQGFGQMYSKLMGGVSVTLSPLPTSPPASLTSPHGILAQDTFRRPNQALWGTASDGHSWGGDANTGSFFSIFNNTGQVSNGYGIYNAVLGSTTTDAEDLFSGSMSSYSNTNLGAVLRWSNTNNWYKAYIDGTTLVVQKKVNGSTTIIGSASFAATAGTSYTLRFRVVGATLYARAWRTGTTEPTNWMIIVSDTTFSSGFSGLRLQVASGVTASYTSFLVAAPGGTPTPTPLPSPSPSPKPGKILAQDTFQRPNQALWGTASDGQTWGADANTGSIFSIDTNTGRVSNGGITSYNAILGPAATNAEVMFTGSMSSYSYNNLGAVLRWNDANNWYKAFIDGSSLVVQKRVNGAYTFLGSVPFTATPGTSYTLRFRAVGATLYAKVWQTGTTEPTNWMIMVSDTTFSSGFCGLRILTQNGTSANYTSFLAIAV
jgi:hypothetical protein